MYLCNKKLALLALALSSGACAPGSSGDSPAEPSTQEATAAAPPVSQPGMGFFHKVTRSKFHLGSGAKSVNDLGLDKVVGSDGVFAVDPRNGSARAILNADSPAHTNFRPLTTDENVHNKATLDYFKAAGLPADQVANVRAYPSLRGGSDGLGHRKPDAFVDFATVVYRQIHGISVADSYAWAIFNEQGEVVSESVHWPSIPDAVIANAAALRDRVGTPAKLATFKAMLPHEATLEDGEVTIRHGSVAEATPAPFASYDVNIIARGNRGHTSHFDITGHEMQHPSSRRSGPNSVKPQH
jgi:hypothetical protein